APCCANSGPSRRSAGPSCPLQRPPKTTLKWCSYLLSLSETFEVLTDHNALKYFMSSKVLTCHHAQWAEFLSEFHFTITYQPRKLAVVPDALSRRDNVYPREGKAFANNNPDNLHIRRTILFQRMICSSIRKR
ncbi:putative retrovirus polyprotein, partial [Puccinia sorghi]